MFRIERKSRLHILARPIPLLILIMVGAGIGFLVVGFHFSQDSGYPPPKVYVCTASDELCQAVLNQGRSRYLEGQTFTYAGIVSFIIASIVSVAGIKRRGKRSRYSSRRAKIRENRTRFGTQRKIARAT